MASASQKHINEARERFLKDAGSHRMEVVLLSGIHRHLRFRAEGTGINWFDIITWPGTLCIRGDWGTYVFSRIEDMFEFFRSPGGLNINPGYWAEKVQAACPRGKVKEFSRERFDENVAEHISQRAEGDDWTEEETAKVMEEVDAHLCYVDGDPNLLYGAIMDFESETKRIDFHDFWECDSNEYTIHFLWCLFAIGWAINQFDSAHHEAVLVPVESEEK